MNITTELFQSIASFKNSTNSDYCSYSFDAPFCLEVTIQHIMQRLKNNNIITDYKVIPTTVDRENDIGVISISWIAEKQLNATTITWRN